MLFFIHFGLGGQAAVGYRVTDAVGLQLYGGITCLTGSRFDDIPVHCHKSNLLYEAGLKAAYHFGRRVASHTAPEGASIVEPQPVVEQKPVVEEKPVLEEAPQPVVETAAVTGPVVSDTVADIPLPVLYFANNSHRLTQREADKLDAVAELLKSRPEATLAIYGHASNVGSPSYNLRLTQRRANTVKLLLMRRGIAGSRLHPVVGRGIDRKAATHKAARRVELVINDKK